jgi:hypothetical protein
VSYLTPDAIKGGWILLPLGAVDTILSAAVDTILLPVDLMLPNRQKAACGGCGILMVMPSGFNYCPGVFVQRPKTTTDLR